MYMCICTLHMYFPTAYNLHVHACTYYMYMYIYVQYVCTYNMTYIVNILMKMFQQRVDYPSYSLPPLAKHRAISVYGNEHL